MGGRPFCVNNAYKIARQFFRSACTAVKKIATSPEIQMRLSLWIASGRLLATTKKDR
jgi:hypothetical protein